MRKNALPVLIPMHKSLGTLDYGQGLKMIDFSAIISNYRPEPTWRKWARRAVKLLTYFW